MRRLLMMIFILTACVMASWAQDASVRALRRVFTTSELRSTVLATNGGWQPIYSQAVEARQGDLLRLMGQIQITVDTAPLVGQQLRLTVDGEPIGSQSIEINTQPGTHHLPMFVYGLYTAKSDQPVTIVLEASSFHSDGDFAVTVDHADNLFYGSLLVEQYRDYADLDQAWADKALLLSDIHQAEPLSKDVWGQAPFIQDPVGSLRFAANQGDILRPSGQAMANATFGLEQFTGVLTNDGRPVSPYGGQNVNPENPVSPMLIEGVDSVAADGQQFLEHRVYGAFGHGLTLVPNSALFEVAQFSSYGRQLKGFGQTPLTLDKFPASAEFLELHSQTVTMRDGDLLRLTGNLQFGEPDWPTPVTVDCRLQLQVEGPDGQVVATSFTGKSLNPIKNVLPLTDILTARADKDGDYRITVKAWGRSDQGVVPLRLDGARSQLQFLHFSRP